MRLQLELSCPPVTAAGSCCQVKQLLHRATSSLPPRSPGCPGLGAGWRVAAGAGCAGWRLAARARAGTTGSSRCGRGQGGWAETWSASAVTKVCIRAGNDPSRSFVSSSSVHQLTIYLCPDPDPGTTTAPLVSPWSPGPGTPATGCRTLT